MRCENVPYYQIRKPRDVIDTGTTIVDDVRRNKLQTHLNLACGSIFFITEYPMKHHLSVCQARRLFT